LFDFDLLFLFSTAGQSNPSRYARGCLIEKIGLQAKGKGVKIGFGDENFGFFDKSAVFRSL
jgi:hypothetical protein